MWRQDVESTRVSRHGARVHSISSAPIQNFPFHLCTMGFKFVGCLEPQDVWLSGMFDDRGCSAAWAVCTALTVYRKWSLLRDSHQAPSLSPPQTSPGAKHPLAQNIPAPPTSSPFKHPRFSDMLSKILVKQ